MISPFTWNQLKWNIQDIKPEAYLSKATFFMCRHICISIVL